MPSILEQIRAKRDAEKASGARPASQQISEADINLRGSGLTKRVIERDAKAYDRETQASMKADKTRVITQTQSEFERAINETVESMRESQKIGDIILDESQLRAVAGIMHNRVSVLIGAAGTGKTTVTKRIVEQLAQHVNVVRVDDTEFVTVREGTQTFRMLRSEAKRNKLEIIGSNTAQDDAEVPGIAFAAYTGRASQQLRRVLPEEWQKNVSTIHSLLGYAPTDIEVEDFDKITGMPYMKSVRRFRPQFDATCKLPYTVYVFDEGSMIPIPLFNEFVDAAPEHSRILIIGDIHQLPPVYGKSVLGFALRKWPTFELTTIHRQAAGDPIISNAHRVLQGKPLQNAENFHLIGTSRDKTPSPAGMGQVQTYVLSVVRKLADLKRYDPYRDAIIVPGNGFDGKNQIGQEPLNEQLVTMFNPEVKENGIIVNKRMRIHTGTGDVFFAIRDKVMITSNINTIDPPITNGMIGIIESININGKYDMKRSQVDFNAADDEEDGVIDLDLDALNFALESEAKTDEKKDKNDDTQDQRQSSHVMTIKFENGQSYSCSTAGDYRRVTHGYAATCHKSQGGEYPNVIIVCHSVNAVMLSQEWLYTAITRARKNVYIICNDRGIAQALKRQIIKGHTIAEKIHSYVVETGSEEEGFDREKFPILWEPEEIV